MSGMYLLASILCLALGSALGADVMEGNYNVTAMCTTVKPGTQLGSIVSCQNYYVCATQGPIMSSCQTGYSYNFKTQACAPSSQVNCYYGVANPCTGKVTDSWVPVAGTCNQWTYCKNEKAGGSGMCGSKEYFDPPSQRCLYGPCENSVLSDGPNLSSPCQVVPPNIYFGSVDNCKAWNYCNTDGSLSTDQCATSAFLVSAGKCGYNSNGECDRIVQDAAPTTCTVSGSMVGDPKICGSYLLCNGQTYTQKNCPNGYYFDTVSNGCALRQSATPVSTCNRCQYASYAFVNAVDTKTCSDYYYCNNGSNGAVSVCPPKFFFDESKQGCAPDSDLKSYTLANGACRGATAAGSSSTTTAEPTTAGSTTEAATTTNEPTTVTTENDEGTG